MNSVIARRLYQLIWLLVLCSDRITKWYVLQHLQSGYTVNQYLSFQLVYNRGISWGIANSADPTIFFLVTTVIIIVIGVLYLYTLQLVRAGNTIFAPLLVLSGAVSNLIDRLVYGAVVDFIVLSYGDWCWPAFNIADCVIVIGVIIMVLTASDQ